MYFLCIQLQSLILYFETHIDNINDNSRHFPTIYFFLEQVLEGNGFNQSLLDDVDLHLECEDESQDFSYVDTVIEGKEETI